MSVLDWKKINLFKIIPSMSLNTNKLSFINREIIAFCYNSEYSIFCDQNGYVHVLRSCWEKPTSFRASRNNILKCSISKNRNFLALLIQDESNYKLSLQVYDLFNIKRKLEPSPILSSVQWIATDIVRVLTLYVEDQNLFIAVGFEKGELLLHRGLLRDNLINFRSFVLSNKPINAIEFDYKKRMFVCTDGEVFCYSLTENRNLEKKVVLDTKNSNKDSCCALQSTINGANPYFLIGRKNAVYCFTSDGLGPCYAIDGLKSGLLWFKQYLVMVLITKNFDLKNTFIVVIDIENKLVVLKKKIANIGGVLTNGNDCYFFTKSNELFILQEYHIENKIEHLLKKNLFDVALRLVNFQDCDAEILANISLQYGNNFLLKGNLELALEKYIQTIGVIDPYIVIKKLLDSKHNTYLLQYLEVLIEKGYGEERHVKLMLNCNERFYLSSSVETYLKSGTVNGLPQYCVVNPDSNVTKKGIIVDVSYSALLNVIENEALALQFFSNMEEQKIYNFFSEHGRNLLNQFPNSVINIFKKICMNSPICVHSPERFVPFLIEHQRICEFFLYSFIEVNYECTPTIYNTLFEIYLRKWCVKNINSDILVSFLNKYIHFVCSIHIMLLCKIYAFWPGLIFVYQRLNKINSIKQNNPAVSITSKFEDPTKHKLLKKFQCENTDICIPPRFVSYLIDKYTSSGKSFLELTNNAIKNITWKVLHYKDILCKKGSRSDLKATNDIVYKCINELKTNNDILYKYLLSPIEFRSSFCNICRQEIYLPATFLLCQHVFHKDCINSNLENIFCNTCGPRNLINESLDIQYLTTQNETSKTDVLKIICTMLEKGLESNKLFENYYKLSLVSLILPVSEVYSNLQRYTTNKNPFEEYDNNLNPFEAEL